MPLIKIILFIITIFLTNNSIANNNEIIFEINKNIYTKVDIKNRIVYLETLNNQKYKIESQKALLDDFFNSTIFFEYARSKNSLKNKITIESQNVYEKIIVETQILNTDLSKSTILNNIKYDLARKIILEDQLSNYREYIFSNSKDIHFIYKYDLEYITIKLNDVKSIDELNKVLKKQNYYELTNYLDESKINYYFKEAAIKDISRVNSEILNLINSSYEFITKKNTDFYKITKINKTLDVTNGIFYKIINIETNQELTNDQQNCNYVKSLKNIKSSNEYEFNKLNDTIKKNLISINDYIVFQNKELLNYIFLCEIKINNKFLEEISINKKIDFIAKDLERDFILKYSKIYNSKKYYE